MSGKTITLMLCGDVMLGRGIDQILPHPSLPLLHEDYVRSALDYVTLAERANGAIPRRAPFAYVWGDALGELDRRKPDLRIINLETAVTRSDRPAPKGINYRMNPANVPCLTTAGIDCCVLANNHVLDWGREGLLETLDAVRGAGIATVGAGIDLAEAEAPVVLSVAGKGRVLVYAAACGSSGVPSDWAAGRSRPGVNLIDEPSVEIARRTAERIARDRRSGDIVVFSIHWGGNWGYRVGRSERAFARSLIESGVVDVVYGHSSHHFKGIEVHRGRPIMYGCGDFLNDYEGIAGYEDYRGDLTLMYFLNLGSADGRLLALDMAPFRIRNFRLNRAGRDDAEWTRETLDRECRAFGGAVALDRDDCALRLAAPDIAA
jgi:poly-gamma-glutamate synthesis protein (capsule biosynthesis protein)